MHPLDMLKGLSDQPSDSSESLGKGALHGVDIVPPPIPNQMRFEDVDQTADSSPQELKPVKVGSRVTFELYDDPEGGPLRTLTLEVAEERSSNDQITTRSAVGIAIMGRLPSQEMIGVSNGKFIRILEVN